MTSLIRAEFRKLRSSRSLVAIPSLAVLISAVSSTVLIATFKESEIASRLSAHGPLRFGATNVGLFLLLFGVRLFTDETQHGTITATYLATPKRSDVIVAKAVVASAVAIVSCVVIDAIVVPVTLIGVQQRGLSMLIDTGATVALCGRVLCAMVLMTLLGLLAGAAMVNRTVALVVSVAWLALGEALIGGLFRIPKLMPGSLVTGLVAGTTPDALPARSAAAVLLAWCVAAAALASWSLRRDV